MKKNLVVGAGFSGATIANLIANKAGEEVVVIDKKKSYRRQFVRF